MPSDTIAQRLQELGFTLPAPLQPPGGARLPFAFVRVRGSRAYVSGHGPLAPDGTLAGPFGKVGAEFPSKSRLRSRSKCNAPPCYDYAYVRANQPATAVQRHP
jgi:hypothetical protein